jgi:hypothetical protein
LVRGPISEVANALGTPRGEYTLVLDMTAAVEPTPLERPTPELVGLEFGEMTTIDGVTRRKAIAALSKRHHLPARTVYDLLEQFKKSGE